MSWFRSRERHLLAILLVAAVLLRVCLVVFSPTPFGYVWDFYYEGVRVLYQRARLPVAADCWQCYHPPLFYLLGWPFYAAGRWIDRGPSDANALRLLGGLSLVCSSLTAYFGYRLLRLFRCRGASLVLGVGLLVTFPCLFISSYGAEADIVVTAILSALVFYLTRDAGVRPPRDFVFTIRLGLLAGLAAATKYSGLVGIAVVVGVLGLHALTGRRRAAAVGHAALAVAICVVVGGWKYVDNVKWYGTPLKANGAAARSFSLERGRVSPDYEFASLRVRDLLDTVGPSGTPGVLTHLPVYRSVITTLHGLAWSDLNFFSDPARHGDPARPYPAKRQVWALTMWVLFLGVVPELLAIAGVVLTITRRRLAPLLIVTFLTAGSYVWWFLAQAEWGLKTKYILFLLPPLVLYAMVGFAWVWRRAPAAGVAVATLLGALIVLTHMYLLMFSLG